MPKPEIPTTPEQNEKPQKPSPEIRVAKNTKAERELFKVQRKNFTKKTDKLVRKARESLENEVIKQGEVVQPVIDEANRGEDAWHKAHKERNTPRPGETDTEKRRREEESTRKIDEIRRGRVLGKERQYGPTTLVNATLDRDRADDVRAGRARIQL